MAASSVLAGLLDRAGEVFELAGQLGQAFYEEHQGEGPVRTIDAAAWHRHEPAFDRLCALILQLKDMILSPPEGFEAVAAELMQAGKVAQAIRKSRQNAEGRTWAEYAECFPELNSVCHDGWLALKAARTGLPTVDPFAFVEQPGLTRMDRFPMTDCGHLAFIEFVRDEVHYAAEAKRHQFARGYANATIESMVAGIAWKEASQRLSAVANVSEAAKTAVACVLARELTQGTVEALDELLTPAVRVLREVWEDRYGTQTPQPATVDRGPASKISSVIYPLQSSETRVAEKRVESSPSAEKMSGVANTGFLGGSALAEALGIHPTRRDAFFRALDRQRMDLGDNWHEVCDTRPNSPHYLYRVDSEALRKLAQRYQAPK